MKFKQKSILLTLLITTYHILHSISLAAQPLTIQQAIESQLQQYPKSTLQDIYKSFFQDEFGPGHLAPDSTGAANYLEYELAKMVSRRNHSAEPCGTGENFCRAPLDLVKDSIIPKEVFLSAFLESARGFREPNLDTWKIKWTQILDEISKMNLNLPGFDVDKKNLDEMLKSGEYVVHHSQIYSEAYDPHYRIMLKGQWEGMNSKFHPPAGGPNSKKVPK